MKNLTKVFVVSAFLQIFICPVLVFAYDDDTTHPALTGEIVDFYNLLHPDNSLSSEEKEWIVSGSILEDEWPRWINHFYDPVRKIGWNGEGVGGVSSESVKLMASLTVTSENPVSSPSWLKSSEIQKKYSRYGGDNTWQVGLVNYARNNREEGFKILGHALHLLEDSSVPDHTRNDTHAHLDFFGDDGSPYEDYLSKWNEKNISSLRIPNNLIISGMHPPALASPEEFIYKLAEYSNNYFFSKDTINSDIYKTPKIEKEEKNFGYGKDENGNLFPLVVVDRVFNSGVLENRYSIKKLDSYRNILDSYFSRLSSKAVLYGAGMIDLFLRQAEEEKIKQEFQSNVIAYDFSFLEIPSFSLAGELNRVKNGFLSLTANVANLASSIGNRLVNFASKNDLDEKITKEVSEEKETIINDAEVEIKILEEEESPIVENKIIQNVKTEEIKKEKLAVLEKEEIFKQVESKIAQSLGNSGSASPKAKPDYRVRFTEIFYDAEGSDAGREWLEIYNYGSESVSLGSLNILEDGTKHGIKQFSGGEILGVGKFLVVADNPEKFLVDNPSFSGMLADSVFSLNNSSEFLDLLVDGESFNSYTYSSSTGAGGDGNSLQRKSDGSWFAKKPTPGTTVDESVNRAPEVVWSFPGNSLVSEVINLTAASSSDPDGDLLSYIWNFGDGQSATGENTKHSYKEAGSYEINLSVGDSKGATSYVSGTIAIGSVGGGAANHLVISEIQVSGIDSGDEFIEIYNPTDSPISLSGWSIQYISGSSEEISPTKKNLISTSTVPAKGFFLIAKGLTVNGDDGYHGVSDLSHRSFSLSGSSSGGIIILVSTTTAVSSLTEISIVDLVSYGSPKLLSSVSEVPEDNQSLERNAFVEKSCFPSINNYEFSGNACDSGSSSDFTIRITSKPQTSLNLLEPRIAPGIPTADSSGLVTYNKNSLVSHIIWGISSGSPSYYEVYESENLMATTTQNKIDLGTSEIGKEVTFKVRAVDSEGLSSSFVEEIENIPSFLSKLDFFWDENKSAYVLRGFYDGELLVPQIKRGSDRPTWSAPVFFLNKEPIYSDSINIYDGQINSPESISLEVPRFNLKRCNGADITGNGITFPDSGSVCPSFGHDSSDTNPGSDEDRYFEFTFEPRADLQNLTSKDFLTVAFYELSSASTYGKYMVLAATDKTHYKFQESLPSFYSPEMQGNLSENLNSNEQKISINFNRAKDRDNADYHLSYQQRSSGSLLSESNLWEDFTPSWSEGVGSLSLPISWKKNVNIELRAKDSRNNFSSPLTLSWSYPNFSTILEQNIGDFWSSGFGSPSDIWRPSADKAAFQSFQVPNSGSFNRVSLQVKNTPIGNYYGGDLRLTVLRGTSTPDFAEILGEATRENYSNEEKELIFTFSNPISLEANIKYWLALDVTSAGRTDNAWQVAVANNNPYPDGEAGEGYFKGPLADCGCSLSQTNPDQDWYFQLYTIP
jgi:hypothetical protein